MSWPCRHDLLLRLRLRLYSLCHAKAGAAAGSFGGDVGAGAHQGKIALSLKRAKGGSSILRRFLRRFPWLMYDRRWFRTLDATLERVSVLVPFATLGGVRLHDASCAPRRRGRSALELRVSLLRFDTGRSRSERSCRPTGRPAGRHVRCRER